MSPTSSRGASNRDRLQVALAALLYVAARRLASGPAGAAARTELFWPANGVALAALLLSSASSLPWTAALLAVLAFVSARLEGHSYAASGALLAAAAAEVGVVWLAFARPRRRAAFDRVQDVLLLMASGAAGCALSGLAGAAIAAPGGSGGWWAGFAAWWSSESLGLLLITPLLVSWVSLTERTDPPAPAGAREIVAFFSAWIAMAWLLVHGEASPRLLPRAPLLLVLLPWAAIRLGTRGVTAALLLLAAILRGEASGAAGATLPPELLHAELPLAMQVFLAFSAAGGLLLTASVTQTRSARRATQDERARLDVLSRNIPNGMFYQVRRTQGGGMHFDYLSAGVEKLHGLSAQAVLDEPGLLYGQVVPEDRARVAQAEDESFRTGQVFDQVVRLRLPSGEVRWRRICSAPRHLQNGDTVWDGLETDVTDQHNAEEDARRGSQHLQLALDSAEMGAWAWDVTTGEVRWSDRTQRILGLPPGELRGTVESFVALAHPDDRERVREALARTARGERDEWPIAHRILWPDGSVHWLEGRGRMHHDLHGRPTHAAGTVLDITIRRNGEEALRLSEARFRSAMQGSPIGMAIVALDGRLLDVNPALCKLFGQTADQLRKRTFQDLTAPEELADDIALSRRMLKGEATGYEREQRYVLPDGREIRAQVNASLVRAENGTPLHFISQFQDITERKRSEEELRLSNTKLKLAMDVARLGHWEFDFPTEQFTFDDGFFAIYGTTAEAQGGYTMAASEYARHFIPPGEAKVVADEIARATASTDPHYTRRLEHTIVRADGSTGFVQVQFRVVRDDAGRILKSYGANQDITERKQAQEALEQQRRRSNAIIESAMDAIVTIGEDHRIVVFNPAAEQAFRCAAAQAIGRSIEYFVPERHRASHAERLRRFAASGVPSRMLDDSDAIIALRADGEEFPIEVSISQVEVDGRKLVTLTCRDVTERNRAIRALSESEERFRQVVEHIQEVFWMSTADQSAVLYVSPGYEKIWGRSCQSLYENPTSWLDAIHPDDRERVARAAALRVESRGYLEEYRILGADGTLHWIEDRSFLVRDAAGRAYRLVGVAQDITDRHQVEEQLLQSQKMEAIGQLAGGVAHDFNNILGAMLMQAEEARSHPGAPPEVRELMTELVQDLERGAALTRQLLMFGRRQVMDPEPVDLNELVTNLAKMLRRVLGEEVRLKLHLHPAPLVTHADPGMIEQAIINLAVNARDAMASGGELTVETSPEQIGESEARAIPNGSAGAYARVRLADSGCGIPPEHLGRIFEPFFTTKAPGKGTGLGLASVFGIIRQHRGMVRVSSEVGRGSTFDLLLKSEDARPRLAEPQPPSTDLLGGHETVLVVEDDAQVRRITSAMLSRFGYRVVQAASGPEALRAWESLAKPADLLVSDMVMPGGMKGTELAAQLLSRAPGLKIILTSGYSPELAGLQSGMLDGHLFLPKPYRHAELLSAMRQLLDLPGGSTSPPPRPE